MTPTSSRSGGTGPTVSVGPGVVVSWGAVSSAVSVSGVPPPALGRGAPAEGGSARSPSPTVSRPPTDPTSFSPRAQPTRTTSARAGSHLTPSPLRGGLIRRGSRDLPQIPGNQGIILHVHRNVRLSDDATELTVAVDDRNPPYALAGHHADHLLGVF